MANSSTTFLLLVSQALALILLLLFIRPVSSTSRGALSRPKPKTGLKVNLRHVDSGKNLTKLERIRHEIKRANYRLNKFNAPTSLTKSWSEPDFEAPTYFLESGAYLMELGIGTPPSPFLALMDTGSHLVWTQCKPCIECYTQPTPIFEPQKSSTFSVVPCSSPICNEIHHPAWYDYSRKDHVCDACPYKYAYYDGSEFTEGILATETLTFKGDYGRSQVLVPNIVFGCSERNEAEMWSIMGLNRGPLFLVSQLEEPKFSTCFTPYDDYTKTSMLLMGSNSATMDGLENVVTTPLIKSKTNYFYYLSLEGISVGGMRLPLNRSTFELQENGNGGTFIDSGTTFTCFQENIYEKIKREFIAQMPLPLDTSGALEMDLCFRLPQGSGSTAEVPLLVYHFEGGDLKLPSNNFLVGDAQAGVVCLAITPCEVDMGNILGNFHNQNMLVTYDLAAETISFAPMQCDQL